VLISDGISIIEKLSILSAWAEIYTSACDRKSNTEKSIRSATQGSFENLLDLVNPELPNLIGYWISVLRDIALLSLPTEFVEQTEYGSLILMHSKTEEYYRRCWPPILLAASIWLRENDFCVDEISMPLPLGPDSVYAVPPLMNGGKESILNLIIGICVESLSKHQSHHCDKTIQVCSLGTFFSKFIKYSYYCRYV
jgi:hypothetical protein